MYWACHSTEVGGWVPWAAATLWWTVDANLASLFPRFAKIFYSRRKTLEVKYFTNKYCLLSEYKGIIANDRVRTSVYETTEERKKNETVNSIVTPLQFKLRL